MCISLQVEKVSAKVLEETYRKWVQYKEDCFNTIRNESLPQSKQLRGRGNMAICDEIAKELLKC